MKTKHSPGEERLQRVVYSLRPRRNTSKGPAISNAKKQILNEESAHERAKLHPQHHLVQPGRKRKA